MVAAVLHDAFFTGFRPNEADTLLWGDVDWQRSSFGIRAGLYRWQEGTLKTESSIREVDMLPMVEATLKSQRAHQGTLRLELDQGAPELGKD